MRQIPTNIGFSAFCSNGIGVGIMFRLECEVEQMGYVCLLCSAIASGVKLGLF